MMRKADRLCFLRSGCPELQDVVAASCDENIRGVLCVPNEEV